MRGVHMYGLLEPLGNNLGIVEKGHPMRMTFMMKIL